MEISPLGVVLIIALAIGVYLVATKGGCMRRDGFGARGHEGHERQGHAPNHARHVRHGSKNGNVDDSEGIPPCSPCFDGSHKTQSCPCFNQKGHHCGFQDCDTGLCPASCQ